MAKKQPLNSAKDVKAVKSRGGGRTKQVAGKTKATQTQLTVLAVYQFKITLQRIKPPIWRRIQVLDCSLDEFQWHVQAAMGWTNSHLHEFEIRGERYGDSGMLEGGFLTEFESEVVDSRSITLSEIIGPDGKRLRFKYTYDFGDNWEHEVLFERSVVPDPKEKYPRCIDGARACPPEDIGGPWGYAVFLEAIHDPTHPRYDELQDWATGFDPEKFDPSATTRAMQSGTLGKWE